MEATEVHSKDYSVRTIVENDFSNRDPLMQTHGMEHVELLLGLAYVLSGREPDYSPTETVKFTTGCCRCLAVTLFGNKKENGEPVSTLAHLTPGALSGGLRSAPIRFMRALHEFDRVVEENSKKPIIAGGIFPMEDNDWGKIFTSPESKRLYLGKYREEYLTIVRSVSEILTTTIGTTPRFIPPKFIPGDTDVFCLTNERKIHVEQNNRREAAQLPAFEAAELESEVVQWTDFIRRPLLKD